MSEKKFRSEEARKNYEKAERNRRFAAKRKELQQKKEAVTARCEDWVKANPKKTAKIVITAVIVILVVWLGCKWFVGPGGSLPNFFGYVRGIEESWVVTDLNPRTNVNSGSSNVDKTSYGKQPMYFRLASLEPLEGYTQDPDFTLSDDETNQDQHYICDDETSPITSVYAFGIPNKTAEKHMADIQSVMSVSNVSGDVATATIGGHEVQYVCFVYDQEANEEGVVTDAYASLCLCIDTTQDACVLVIVNSAILPKEEIPPVEELLAFSEGVLEKLTVY